MRNTINRVLLGGMIVVLSAAVYISLGKANVSKASMQAFTPNNCYSAAATSTLGYMSPGLGTTTVTCNMGADGSSSAVVLVQANASSTNTVYNFFVEESMDGQDWYPVSLSTTFGSTTAPMFGLKQNEFFYWKFASSTIGQAGEGAGTNYLGASTTVSGNNRNHVSFEVPVRMMRVRVHAALQLDSRNGAIWMKIMPRQDVN